MSGSLILIALAFLAGFFAIFAVNLVITDLFLREREIVRKRMEAEMRDRERQRIREDVRDRDLQDLAAEAFVENAERKSVLESLKEAIDQADVDLTPAQLMGISAALAVMTGLPIGVLGHVLGGFAWLAFPVSLVAFAVPFVYVLFKRRQRVENLRKQLPDSLDLMSRILRAGQTMTQAMLAISDEFKPPVATEFGICYEQQNLGLSPELALRDLAQRTGLIEIKIFVLALLVHRRTGGNLAELLDKLSAIVRERFKLRGKISAMTAEGRLQAAALLALPPVMFLLLLVVNRDYALKLLDYPALIAMGVAGMAVGAVWIRRVVNFEF